MSKRNSILTQNYFHKNENNSMIEENVKTYGIGSSNKLSGEIFLFPASISFTI
jgi:hypothetical protein